MQVCIFNKLRAPESLTSKLLLTALPHDRVADDQLYRLLDADAPYTPRVKSLLRWLAHRKRDQLPFIQASRSSADRAPTPTAAQSMATELIDDFIAGLSDRSITFIAEPSAKPIVSLPHLSDIAQYLNCVDLPECERHTAPTQCGQSKDI